MRVVSDTSPISNLAIIGRLNLLTRLHGTVIISPVVADELARLRHADGRAEIEAAIAAGWLKVESPTTTLPPLPSLHAGEMESIALAASHPGTLLLMDETEGREAARLQAISVTGAIGVLMTAKRNGWISELKPELLALRERARFFLSERIFREALTSVGETP